MEGLEARGAALSPLTRHAPQPHFWDLEVINLVTWLPSCECIETVPSVKTTPGFHRPRVGAGMLRELTADPHVGGWCLRIQLVLICTFSSNTPAMAPPSQHNREVTYLLKVTEPVSRAPCAAPHLGHTPTTASISQSRTTSLVLNVICS